MIKNKWRGKNSERLKTVKLIHSFFRFCKPLYAKLSWWWTGIDDTCFGVSSLKKKKKKRKAVSSIIFIPFSPNSYWHFQLVGVLNVRRRIVQKRHTCIHSWGQDYLSLPGHFIWLSQERTLTPEGAASWCHFLTESYHE